MKRHSISPPAGQQIKAVYCEELLKQQNASFWWNKQRNEAEQCPAPFVFCLSDGVVCERETLRNTEVAFAFVFRAEEKKPTGSELSLTLSWAFHQKWLFSKQTQIVEENLLTKASAFVPVNLMIHIWGFLDKVASFFDCSTHFWHMCHNHKRNTKNEPLWGFYKVFFAEQLKLHRQQWLLYLWNKPGKQQKTYKSHWNFFYELLGLISLRIYGQNLLRTSMTLPI